MKSISNALDKLCYGAFYARKTHPSNPPDNHDLDTLIQTEAIFITTGMVFIASIMFTLVGIMPCFIKYAPILSLIMIAIAIVIPMLLFRPSRFMKIVKNYEAKDVKEQLSAKKVWRTFFWSTWIIVTILLIIASLLNFI